MRQCFPEDEPLCLTPCGIRGCGTVQLLVERLCQVVLNALRHQRLWHGITSPRWLYLACA